MIAYCYASGEIEFTNCPSNVPSGAIAFANNTTDRPDLSDEDFVKSVKIRARFSKDAKTLLVPGVPEAEDQAAALRALQTWVNWAFKTKAKAKAA